MQYGLSTEWESHVQGYSPDPSTILVYPIAQVNGLKIPVQRLFFGIKHKKYNISDPNMKDPGTRLTNMESVSVSLRRLLSLLIILDHNVVVPRRNR